VSKSLQSGQSYPSARVRRMYSAAVHSKVRSMCNQYLVQRLQHGGYGLFFETTTHSHRLRGRSQVSPQERKLLLVQVTLN
jgi:hypothetical protein